VSGSANFDPGGYTRVTKDNIDTLPLQEYQRKDWLKDLEPGSKHEHWVRVEPRGATLHAKFYFQHLVTDENFQKFIDLYNAKKMNIGYPGHFYSKPYFMRFVTKEEIN
jgi:hypothetical protein